jgi:hypothetical protein
MPQQQQQQQRQQQTMAGYRASPLTMSVRMRAVYRAVHHFP